MKRFRRYIFNTLTVVREIQTVLCVVACVVMLSGCSTLIRTGSPYQRVLREGTSRQQIRQRIGTPKYNFEDDGNMVFGHGDDEVVTFYRWQRKVSGGPDKTFDVFLIRKKLPGRFGVGETLVTVMTFGIAEVYFVPVAIWDCLVESLELRHLIVEYDADGMFKEYYALPLEPGHSQPRSRIDPLTKSKIDAANNKDDIPALIADLNDRDGSVRLEAVYVLGRIGLNDKVVVRAILSAMTDEYNRVRIAAAYALGQFGPQFAKETVPALIAALGDQEEWVRRTAAKALGSIGPTAKDAIPALTKALEDEDISVSKAAQAALKKIEAK